MLVHVASKVMLLCYKKYCKIYASTCWVKRYAILLQWKNIVNIRFFFTCVYVIFKHGKQFCFAPYVNKTWHALFLSGFICVQPLCTALCCSSTRGQLPQASLQYTAHQLSSSDYPTYVSLSCSCLKCPDGRGGNRKVLYREKTEYSLKKQLCAPYNIQLSVGHPVY